MREKGISDIADFENGALIGNQLAPSTQDPITQTRSSSESAFLRSALANVTNLAVFTNALAKRIVFSEETRAAGVEVSSLGQSFTLNANKEVILSAGAVRSSSSRVFVLAQS